MPINITLRAGTNRPVRFAFPDTFDTGGKTFRLYVAWASDRRVYELGSGLMVVNARTVEWTYPLTDSRAFPAGSIARIELEWRTGGIQDSDAGVLTILPGISDD